MSLSRQIEEINAALDTQIKTGNEAYWDLIKLGIQKKLAGLSSDDERSSYLTQLTQTFDKDLGKIETVIASLKASEVVPNPARPNHTVDSIPHLLDNIVNYKETLKAEEKALDFLTVQDPDKFSDFIDNLLEEGLPTLIQTQDPDQAYHQLLHAMEMFEDGRKKMQFLVQQNSLSAGDGKSRWAALDSTDKSPLCLFVGALAAFHDLIQNKGQFKNELESAKEFSKFFNTIYTKTFSQNPPAELAKVAEHLIVDGTLLNIGATKNSVFDIIQQKAMQALGVPEPAADSAHTILGAGKTTLAQNDTHRATETRTHDLVFPTQDGALPEDLKNAFRETLINGLTQTLKEELRKTEHISDTKEEALRAQVETLVDHQLPAFMMLIGQNTRMLADGPFRKFKDQGMEGIMAVLDQARFANLGAAHREKYNNAVSQFIQAGLSGFFTNSLIGPFSESDFSKKQNNLEAIENHKTLATEHTRLATATRQIDKAAALNHRKIAAYHDDMVRSLESQVLSPLPALPLEWKSKFKNTWEVHANLFLPALQKALKQSPEMEHKLLSGVLFCAANQQGLDILASKPKLLAALFKKTYGISIQSNLKPEKARQAASVFMHLSQNREMNLTLKNPEQSKEKISEVAQTKAHQFIDNTIVDSVVKMSLRAQIKIENQPQSTLAPLQKTGIRAAVSTNTKVNQTLEARTLRPPIIKTSQTLATHKPPLTLSGKTKLEPRFPRSSIIQISSPTRSPLGSDASSSPQDPTSPLLSPQSSKSISSPKSAEANKEHSRENESENERNKNKLPSIFSGRRG